MCLEAMPSPWIITGFPATYIEPMPANRRDLKLAKFFQAATTTCASSVLGAPTPRLRLPTPRLRLPHSRVSTHAPPVHAGAPLGLAPFVMAEDDHLLMMRQRQRTTESILRERQPCQVTAW